MKTLEEILSYQGGENCNFVDCRDKTRLARFIPPDQWEKFGLKIKDGVKLEDVITEPFTKENVLSHLKNDLAFAFEKALNQRGISSSLMFDVVKMWMWVLNDELADFSDDNYAQYGLPLYKAVAVKYNLPNPIGEDKGDEHKYSEEYEG